MQYCTVLNITDDITLPFDFITSNGKVKILTPNQFFYNDGTKYNYLGTVSFCSITLLIWKINSFKTSFLNFFSLFNLFGLLCFLIFHLVITSSSVQRNVRGMTADVWVAKTTLLTAPDQEAVIEWYFAPVSKSYFLFL